MARIVVGADVCKGAWAAVRLVDGCFDQGTVLPTLSEVATTFGREATVIAMDIPLSYTAPGTKGRACEQEGRRLLGELHSCMFDTYPKACLDAPDYATANALAKRTIGCGISRQSFGLGKAIREATTLAEHDPRLRETHPELVFASIAGSLASKKTWKGSQERLKALEMAGLRLPVDTPGFSSASLEDILDAAAAALVADRIALGSARRVPDLELEPAIWF